MPKPVNAKKSDQKPSKKRLPAKQEKPIKDIKVKHAPPVSSKDIIAKAEANAAKPPKSKRAPKPVVKEPVSGSSSPESEPHPQLSKAVIHEIKTNRKSAPSKKISPTQPPATAKSQKTQKTTSSDSSSNSDSSGNDSSSEDEASPKPLAKANGAHKPTESDGSSEEESSEESSSDESTTGTKPSTVQKAPPNDDSGDSEDDSSEDEKPKGQQVKAVLQPSTDSSDEELSSSSGDSDSGSDSDTPLKPPAAASKKSQSARDSSSDSDSPSSGEDSSGSASDEDAEMEDRTPAVVTTGKRKAENDLTLPAKKAKMINGSPTIAKPEGGSTKTIFVGNLSWAVDNDRLSQEFADCGEVVSARVQLDRNTGRSRGFGYVTFATTEAVDAAIALNGAKEIDGRILNLDKSTDGGANREKRAQAFGDVRSARSKVLFVGNLSWNTVEDTLWDAFSEYGEVNSIRLPTDKESGKPKGYGYIEFSAVDSAQKAIDAMNGKELDGRPIRLDFSQPRDLNAVGGGRGAGFGGGRGRGGFDIGRGRGSGRGRGNDRGRGRGGARSGMRTGAIATSEGKKITF